MSPSPVQRSRSPETAEPFVAVLTAADLSPATTIPLRLAPLPGFDRYLQPPLAGPLVRYVGEPVAVAALAPLGIIVRDLPLSPANIARWIREARRGG